MRKIIKRNRFTLVELLMAMAIFTIISMVMMRFFNSAQKVWSSSSQRNILYSNARIALDIMSRDLQCALYKEVNFENNDMEQGIYPFWFQKINGLNTVSPTYYPVNRFGPDISVTPNIPEHYWTCLNFITPTSVKPVGVKSSTCKLRYTFIPSGMYMVPDTGKYIVTPTISVNGGQVPDENQMNTIDNGLVAASRPKTIRDGWLVRSCTGDRDAAGNVNPKYNFSQLPITAFTPASAVSGNKWDKWRMNAIFVQSVGYNDATNNLVPTAANSSFATWERVIPNVVELYFECYYYDNTGALQKFNPMELNNIAAVANTPTVPTPIWDSASYGTYFPAMVWIQISLLSDSDWTQWRRAVESNDAAKANTILSQKLRTFSKIVFLDKRESN